MHEKQFLSPAEVADELSVSSSTVLRLIHSGDLPAIAVSDRIYRIPRASFEMFKAGTLRRAEPAPLGGRKPRPRLGEGEGLPAARSAALVRHT
ncbi:MAG: helix-turn-helix domain-containing protein [Chloroflexi bacterium]|nr:helix-turn-helix domain-containing protein [Chloroflexota bacterium]MDA8238055.1 helix-turn-helix domain-containing protein [Chloroflexota bacterium]